LHSGYFFTVKYDAVTNIKINAVQTMGGKKVKTNIATKTAKKMIACINKNPFQVSAGRFFILKYQLHEAPKRHINVKHRLKPVNRLAKLGWKPMPASG
jgi:Txe/YoeB family toxin of Txe-Axe toxin-antitoxin module